MKKLNIQISILCLLLSLNFVKADHRIDLRIISSNSYVFIIQLSDIKYDTQCLLLNQQGVVIYKEDIASADSYRRSLNLMELPDGTYELKIEDDYKIETITLIKNNGKVAAANQVKTIAFKPQIVLKDRYLRLSAVQRYAADDRRCHRSGRDPDHFGASDATCTT